MSLSDKEREIVKTGADTLEAYIERLYSLMQDNIALRQSLREVKLNLAHEEALSLESYYEDIRRGAAWSDFLDIKAMNLSSARKERDDALAKIKELEARLLEQRGGVVYLCLKHDYDSCPKCVDDLRQAESTIAQMAEALKRLEEAFYPSGGFDNYEWRGVGDSPFEVIEQALALPLVVSILERQRGKKA